MENNQRKLFRYNTQKDIMLLKEVVVVNPYSKTGGWGEVKKGFITALREFMMVTDILPTERSVGDRVQNLLEKFKKDELSSLRASGTDEEVSERNELLREVKGLKDEATAAAVMVKEEKNNSEKEEEKRAKDIRQKAMEGLRPEGPAVDEEKPRKRKSNMVFDYLAEKSKREFELKEKEINLTHERALKELT